MILISAIIGYVGVTTLGFSAAASNQLYLSPASNAVATGQQFNVSLKMNTTNGVDGIQATIKYDPTVLELVTIDNTTSAFPIELSTTKSAGMIDIQRGIFAPNNVSGDVFVSTISFKALKAGTTSDVTLSGNATLAGSYTNPLVTGATVAIAAPTPAPAPTPPPPSPDTTAPIVNISQPVNGSVAAKTVTITASAVDNVKVVRSELYIDGKLTSTVTNGSITYKWNTKARGIANGNHQIVVRAYDAAGNSGQAAVTVVKK